MPFRRVRPQLVEHTDGWSVGTGDRWNMEYEEPGRLARVTVEFSGAGTVNRLRLCWFGPVHAG